MYALTSSGTGIIDLPFDVLSEVINHACLITHVGYTSTPTFGVSPLLLCQVCQTWAAFLKKTPRFWTSIIINLQNVSHHGAEASIEGLNAWVERSVDRLLAMHINGVGADAEVEDELKAFVRQLGASSYRWKSYELNLVNRPTATVLSAMVRSHSRANGKVLPLLQSFRVNSSTLMYDDDSLQYFEDCAQLQELHFCGYSGTYLRKLMNVHPVVNITALTLHNTRSSPFIAILTWFPLLRRVEFCNVELNESHGMPGSPDDLQHFTHSHLQSFRIEAAYWTDVVYVLAPLRAPKLVDFSLCVLYNYRDSNITPHIKAFIELSRCNLQELSLILPTAPTETLNAPMEEDIISLLSRQTKIHTFHLRLGRLAASDRGGKVGLTDAFFRALDPTQRTNYLPNLVFFKYVGPLITTSTSYDFLQAFVHRAKSNWPPNEAIHASTGDSMDIIESTDTSADHTSNVVRMNFAKITADQPSSLLPYNRQKTSDNAEMISEIIRLQDIDRLWLMNRNFATFWSL